VIDKDLVVTLLKQCNYPYRERKRIGRDRVPTKWSGLVEADVHDGELFFYFVDGDLTDIRKEVGGHYPGFENPRHTEA